MNDKKLTAKNVDIYSRLDGNISDSSKQDMENDIEKKAICHSQLTFSMKYVGDH